MKVKELIAALQALPSDQHELEICSIAETWAIEILPPHMAYLNEQCVESVDVQGRPRPTGRKVIVI